LFWAGCQPVGAVAENPSGAHTEELDGQGKHRSWPRRRWHAPLRARTPARAFAEGCFWGSEDTSAMSPGVVATAVGYTGGHTAHPTYEMSARTPRVTPKPFSWSSIPQVTYRDSSRPSGSRTTRRRGIARARCRRSVPERRLHLLARTKRRRARSIAESKSTHRQITTEVDPSAFSTKAEAYPPAVHEKTGRRSLAHCHAG